MPALIVYGVLPVLALTGIFAPALDAVPSPETCVERSMQCALTVAHFFSY